MAVQTRTDKRFRRVHVRPSRRRRAAATRRRIAWGGVVLCGVGLAAFFLPGALSNAGLLRVDTITVLGNKHVSYGEILALTAQLHGENILVADLEAHRENLMTLGWLESATLRRVLPSTIEVSVEERRPIGLARFGGRLYLIDESATVIDEYGPWLVDRDFPIIDGLSNGTEIAVDQSRARLASSLIAELETDAALASRVSQIDVENPYDAVILLSESPTLIHLGNEQFIERLREYLELLPTLRAYVSDIDYVDLRFDRRVFIRPVESGDLSLPRVVSSRGKKVNIQ